MYGTPYIVRDKMAVMEKEAPLVHLALLAKTVPLDCQGTQVPKEKRVVEENQVNQEHQVMKDRQEQGDKQAEMDQQDPQDP